MAEDFYKTLGVSPSAEAMEIKKAYRKLARQYHPDRNQGDAESESKFKDAAEAYRVVGDSELRAEYDAYLAGGGTGGQIASSETAEDVLGEIFGTRASSTVGSSRQPRRPQAPSTEARRPAEPPQRRRSQNMPERGSDLRYNLEIDIEDSAFGAEKTIYVPRNARCRNCGGTGAQSGSAPVLCSTCRGSGSVRTQQGFFEQTQRCPDCQGAGQLNPQNCHGCDGSGVQEVDAPVRVNVPMGVSSGARLKLSGEGQAGVAGAPPGDLFVVLEIRPHPLFEREDDDLLTEVPITFSQAALGVQVAVPTLEGKVRMRVPAGSQSGRMFRLKGKGFPRADGRGHGDQRVRVRVETPTHLGQHEQELYEELAEMEAERPPSEGVVEYHRKIQDYFG